MHDSEERKLAGRSTLLPVAAKLSKKRNLWLCNRIGVVGTAAAGRTKDFVM